MLKAGRDLAPEQLGSLRCQILASRFGPSAEPLSQLDERLGRQFKISPATVTAFRARVTNAAREALRLNNIPDAFSTDLLLLAFRSHNAGTQQNCHDQISADVRKASGRMGTTPSHLWNAIELFMPVLDGAPGVRCSNGEAGLNSNSFSTVPRSSYAKLSREDRVKVRKELLAEIVSADPKSLEQLESKLSRLFGVSEQVIKGTRAWVKEIRPRRCAATVNLDLKAEERLRQFLEVANWHINHGKGLDSQFMLNKIGRLNLGPQDKEKFVAALRMYSQALN